MNEAEKKAVGDLLCELLPKLQRRAENLLPIVYAQDIVQISCLKILSRSTELTQHPNLSAYAMRVVVTTAYDHMRSGRRECLTSELPECAEPRDDIAHIEADWEVERLLSEIPKRQAEAVRLVDVMCLTIDQAAEVLGVHRGTVSRSRTRGLKALRSKIEARPTRRGSRL